LRLELGTFPVERISFTDRTRWSEGTLEVNQRQLTAAILQDSRVTSVRLELVRPGESVRITSVRDVIEPRYKVSGPGVVYPGICGRPVTVVGQGRTHRLSGVALIEVAEVEMYRGNDAWLDGFIDMAGPGAVSPYAKLQNLCVVLDVDRSLSLDDQNTACHRAALLVSDSLAMATKDLRPPVLETFELRKADPGLPRAVYITCHRSPQHYANSLFAFWTSIYGFSRQTPPWVLHPNELLDGAISVRTSWDLVNNPLLRELYARHGKDFAFAGVIAIRTRWSAQNEKDITSLQTAKTAQMLGADGAAISWDSGGNDFMEVIRTVQACERAGVKTVWLTGEESPDTGGPALLEPLPEAQAIVSVGYGSRLQSGRGTDEEPLPGVDRLFGQERIVADSSQRQMVVPAKGPLPAPRWADHFGFGRISCLNY